MSSLGLVGAVSNHVLVGEMIAPSFAFGTPFAVLAVHAFGMRLAFWGGLLEGVVRAIWIAGLGAIPDGVILLPTVPADCLPRAGEEG